MQEKLKSLSLRMILAITDTKTELKLHTLLDRSRYPDAFSIPRFGHCKLRSTSGMRTRRKRPYFNTLDTAQKYGTPAFLQNE